MVTVNEDTMSTIKLNGSTITLLGTAHISKESVELVEEKILSKDFDCIAVELCPARYENLKNRSWWKNLDIYEVFKKKKASLLLINLALSAYQRRLADKVGVEAGKEMIRATELAAENDIRLSYVTARAWLAHPDDAKEDGGNRTLRSLDMHAHSLLEPT